MKMSIVNKTWLGFFIIFALILVSLGGFLSWYTSAIYFKHQVGELVNHGRDWALLTSGTEDPKVVQESMRLMDKLLSYHFGMVDANGKVLLSSSEEHMPTGSIRKYSELTEALKGQVVTTQEVDINHQKILTVLVPYEQNGKIAGVVAIHSPMDLIEQAIWSVQKVIIIGVVLAVMISSLLALLVSKRLSKPLLEMNKVAIDMTKGNFFQKVTVVEPFDEVGILGSTINKLSDELSNTIMALRVEREQLSKIIESMTDGVVSFDMTGKILLENVKGMKLKSSNIKDSASVNIFGTEVKELFEKVVTENQAFQITKSIDNTVILVKMSPLHENSAPNGAVALFQDVTREHQMEQIRREFVAVVSHELRSPLGLIQGYAEALRDGLAGAEIIRDRYISIILDETDRLSRLVRDMLDISSLEVSQKTDIKEIIYLKPLLERVISRFGPTAANEGIKFMLNVQSFAVFGEEDRLEQVVVNLLDNALRFTPAGGTITVETHGQKDSVLVSFTDTGVGIDITHLPHIWRKFYKVDKARTLGKGGTGLGLAIVKGIIEGSGGQVFVTSTLSKGSCFSFTLPLAPFQETTLR